MRHAFQCHISPPEQWEFHHLPSYASRILALISHGTPAATPPPATVSPPGLAVAAAGRRRRRGRWATASTGEAVLLLLSSAALAVFSHRPAAGAADDAVQLPADAAAHSLQLPEDAAAWDEPPQPAGRAPLRVPVRVPGASRRAAPSPDTLRCCRCTSASVVVLVTRCCASQIHMCVLTAVL